MRHVVTLSIGVLLSVGTGVVVCLAQQKPAPGSGFATWDSKKGAWSDGTVGRPEASVQSSDLGTEAGIRAQADRIFPFVSQTPQREMWIANHMSEQQDRQRGNSLSIRVNR
jgi:hypothetical protein